MQSDMYELENIIPHHLLGLYQLQVRELAAPFPLLFAVKETRCEGGGEDYLVRGLGRTTL